MKVKIINSDKCVVTLSIVDISLKGLTVFMTSSDGSNIKLSGSYKSLLPEYLP